jgi:hypothetical protein
VSRKPDPAALLTAAADALTACEQAGLRLRLRHGGIIETRGGYVVRIGREWMARTAAWTEFSETRDEDED